MANTFTFKYFICSICILGIELIASGRGNGPSSSKIPVPKQTHPLERKYCISSNETVNVIGTCTPNALQGGSKSPCQPHCFAAYEVKPGDPCDPFLYRFARRAYDDATGIDKDWMGAKPGSRGIIGRPFSDVDADYQYKGLCRYLCPRAMCMGVEVDTAKDGEQYVDLVLWDCVSDDLLDKYRGVCSCGYLWSLVDPHNSVREMNNKTYLVEYKRTVGLNRRLAWDHEHQRCAAQRYGHCSLLWEGVDDKVKTYCMNPKEFQCVNRSANFLGVAYRPFQVEKTKLWYGICDSQVLIKDPFGGGITIRKNNWIMSFLLLAPILSQYITISKS